MRNNNLTLLSGRVKKLASTSAASDRYTWLDLKNAEPDAGVPAAHSSTRGIFASDTSGTRDWLYADAGLSVDTGTGYITVNENTVFIDTTGFSNSTSDNLADVLFDLDQNLGQTQQQTLSSVATDNTIDGNGTSGAPLSIGQGVRYSDDPTFLGLAINTSKAISNIALTNPMQVTTSATHNITDGDAVTFRNIVGTVELNGNTYYADSTGATTFTLYSDPELTTAVDGTSGFTAYSTGGFVMTGGYIFPNVDGTDGTYLKTNGYGELEFDRPIQYGGSEPANPDIGDMWYDITTTNDLLIYNGTSFVSATGGGQSGAFTLVQFQGDGSTTQFDTQSPSVQKVIVFLNGILLRFTDDYTYSTGVITFNAAPRTGDTIEVLLTGNASLIDLATLGIANHDLITVDSSGNITVQGTLDMDGNGIINLPTPTNSSDAATKGYVDTAIAGFSSNLSIAGDTGTDTVGVGTDTLTVNGTANEIETAVTDNTITVGLPSAVTITTSLTTPTLNFGSDASLSWNSVDGTVDISYTGSGATLQVGQEQHYYAKATENIANGDVVMFAGAQGDHILIAKADLSAVGFIDQWVLGLATEEILNNEFGYVTSFGKVRQIDITGTGWSEGDLLWADPNNVGGLTNTQPTSPDHSILMAAVVGINGTNAVLLVRPTFGHHLSDLHDVFVNSGTLANNQVLVWDSTDERWENVTLSTTQLAEGTNLFYTDARVQSLLNGNLTTSIIPSVDDTYDLGSPTNQWRDLYLGPGSLYINNKKVFEESGDTIIFTTDENKHINITTTGTGNITLAGNLITVSNTFNVNDKTTITNDGSNPLDLNRLTTTGDMISFQIDGVQQGTIGIDSLNSLVFEADNGDYKLRSQGETILQIQSTEVDVFKQLNFNASVGNQFMVVEGSIDDTNEVIFAVTNPTADRTITFPDQTGTVALSSTTDGTSPTFAALTTTGDAIIGGNLTVNGTTTSVNTETINLADNIIILNSNETGTPTQNAGIEVERGTGTNVSILWNESTDQWTLTNDGTNFYSLITSNDNVGNANTLDNLDSTQFLRSDVADTKTAGDLSFSDNVKAVFGAGLDLQIYSDGNSSFIKEISSTGSLFIDGNFVTIRNGSGTETKARFVDNGESELYYDNNLKLATTSTGVSVTGTVATSNVTIDSTSTISADSATTTSTTETAVASFAVASYSSAKFTVQAKDTTTGEVQISELLVVHDGSTASATEYGNIFTGSSAIASYNVDINSGNVRLLATSATANNTTYKVSKTLMAV
jgi:hypothetical protein